MPDTTSDPIAEVLGKLPSGCSILTAGHEGRSTGMLASWIQQGSFEPLLLTVAVKHGRPLVELVEGSGRFIVNILGAGTLKRCFATSARALARMSPLLKV